jgi:pimeloyl-ACP methyl ester carboxylesterase
LGSDLPTDSSPEAQARAYREILDREGIEGATVIGVSAGGAPSIRFALDYPERTHGLVLVAADVPTQEPAEPAGPPHFLLHDFPFWLMTGPARGAMFAMFGLDRKAYRNASEAQQEGVDTLLASLLPLEPRRAGMINDELVTNLDMSHNYEEYPLETLATPTIVFQAKDDPLAKYEKVRTAAARIPDCELNVYESGGHLLFGHGEEIDRALTAFLTRTGVATGRR